MAMRNIVMPIAPGRYDPSSLRRAITLAKRLPCHLDVVFLLPDPKETFIYTGIEPTEQDGPLSDIRDRMEDHGRSAAEASRRLFAKLRKEAGLELRQKPSLASTASGAWHRIKGEPQEMITPLARRADATIFTPETARYTLMADNVLEAALLRSGRPVLYLPGEDGQQVDISRVMIAWDGSSACVRAISAWLASGLPLQEVFLVHVADPHEDQPNSDSIRDHLAWHGVPCTVETRRKGAEPVGAVLAEAAVDLHCGLIVMGGYGHFRSWEAIFGGVTRYMIHHAQRSLFMMH
ncbi:hypothetical protein JL2886_00442 [Phaeobacter gallaeciensis]|uniref:Universal stress protein n=1 Tax=Phaeobacter gallaeciensis TaxID=60890 RepID=A0A1B0ZMG7_9RHOB|nr:MULTISPECIES: universal stress protein [Phaeobacter]ANP35373.1 hypothetical protein JL2886_00442 [Phaeobacter gallaeciensis]MEE2634272.1 universal stress protein [Pseudomonadota bacterium]PVZ51173.1 hypothetical protein DD556_00980 [Phaeobacter sp. JL2872]